MTMAKKDTTLKFKADSSNAEKGINNLTSKLNSLAKTVKNNPITKLSESVTFLGKGFGTVSGIVSKAAAAFNECTEAYKTQAKAEVQLETAAKNNPYLDSNSVEQLKSYASGLQAVSAVGDEQLLPFMAELAAAGRTQTEIQDIMSAAVDASASGMISLDSAVKSLNSSYSGSAGQLSKLLPAVKDLSEEELKQGAAIKLVKQSMGGMAESVANTVGASQKLSNAVGDFKEVVGNSFNKAVAPVQNFFAKLIQGWADAASARQKYLEAENAVNAGTANAAQTGSVADKKLEELKSMTSSYIKASSLLNGTEENLKKAYRESGDLYFNGEEIQTLKQYKEYLQSIVDDYNKLTKAVMELNKESQDKAAQEKSDQEAADAAKANADAYAKEVEQRDKLRQQYAESIQQKQNEIEARKKAGEEISTEEENLELYNTALNSYTSIMSNVAFSRDKLKGSEKMWAGEQDMLDEISGYADKANLSYKNLESQVEKFATTSKEDQLSALEQTKTAFQNLIDGGTLTEAELAKVQSALEGVNKAIDDLNSDSSESLFSNFQTIFNSVNDYVTSLADSMSEISDLVSQTAENNATVATAEIEKQLADGLISEEEYAEKKEEIEKESAEKSYKIQMWAWSLQLLSIASSTATAIMQTWADESLKTAVKAIMSATIGLTGATQLATAIANKPTPPSFATGGFLTGNSYSGDKIPFMGNAGEAILNPAEQRAFMAMANGEYGNNRTSGLNVEIKNYKGNDTGVSTSYDGNKLKIIVDGIVKNSMANGSYNSALTSAQNSINGTRYTN